MTLDLLITKPLKSPLAGITLLYALLLLPIDTGQTELARALSDACHGPLFALVAIIALRYLTKTKSAAENTASLYFKAFLIAVLLGIVGEIAQYLFTTTRYAQAKDVLTDTLGAITGLSWLAQTDSRLRIKIHVKKLLLFAIAIGLGLIIFPLASSSTFYLQRWHQLPALISLDSKNGYHFLHSGNSTATLSSIPTAWNRAPNETALLISPHHEGRWTGVTLEEPTPNWSAYSYLVLELINPNEIPMELNLRIDDRKHNQEFNDRFNRVLTIPRSTRVTIKISINEIAHGPQTRQLDTKDISKLVLFEDLQKHSLPFYLCAIRLE